MFKLGIMKLAIGSLFVILLFTTCTNKSMDTIKVDVNKIQYTMQGGLGASWHAISKEIDLENHLFNVPVREVGPRGSAYGGNPPVANSKAWQDLKNHASWLGLNFIRVELSQRMFHPEKDRFDWDNEEMQALYHILDWAEENGADVFLQQMWMYVSWNAIPGIHPLISAPSDLDAYANSIATLIEYLTKEKGYTCIKYFCMTNEPPGGTWGYWWEPGETENTTTAAWKRLRQAFSARNIDVLLSGPDWTDMPPFEKNNLGFSEYLDAIDIHSYHGVTAEGEENLKKWATWAHAHNKPFLLTEYGNMNLGWGTDDPNQKSFKAALSNASDVIRGLRARVDGFNRWSFTNRGDLDGQWQLVHTWDREKKTYLNQINPEPEAYYGFAIISRFLSKYSAVVETIKSMPDSLLMCASLLSPKGEVSVLLVNDSREDFDINLDLTTYIGRNDVHLYQVSEKIIKQTGFELKPLKKLNASKNIELKLPAKSISNVSSYHLDVNEPGIIYH